MGLRRLILLAGVAACMVAIPASAVAPEPLRFQQTFSQFDSVIEQESPNFLQYNCPVTNDPSCDPSMWVYRSLALRGCFWDADDHATWLMVGNRATLAAGERYTLSLCVIGNDPAYMTWAQFFGLTLTSSSPHLEVSITITPDGLPGTYTHILPPVSEANKYEYRGCLGGPVYAYSGNAGLLPDTNGGTGTPAAVHLTISNPTRRSARIDHAGVLVAQGDYHFQASSGGFRSHGGYIYYCRHDNPMNAWRPLMPDSTDPAYYADRQ